MENIKYALVTGASRGIGRAVAIRLSSEGYNVIINYLSNDAAASDVMDEIVSAGGKAELLKFDVSDPEAVDCALENWENSHPGEYISVLVNNAGVRDDSLMVFMSDEQWKKVLSTDLDSFFYVTRRLLKNMLSRRFGRIVLFGGKGRSDCGDQGSGSGNSQTQGYRQCRGSWIYFHRYGFRSRRERIEGPCPCRALRQARGGGGRRFVPCFRRRFVHNR